MMKVICMPQAEERDTSVIGSPYTRHAAKPEGRIAVRHVGCYLLVEYGDNIGIVVEFICGFDIIQALVLDVVSNAVQANLARLQ